MSPIRKGTSVLFAILFVATAWMAQILFNLEHKAFAPETYQQAFANDNFYERLPGLLAQSLTGTFQAAQLPVSMRALSPQIWEQFMRDLLPPQTIREMGDQALTSLTAYLNEQSDSAVLSLTPLKEQMASEAGMQAVLNLLRTQPACTLPEIGGMTMALLSQGKIALCNPPENLYPVVMPVIQGEMKLLSAALPDEVALIKAEPLAAGQADPREQIRVVRTSMRLSPLIPLLFLIALTISAVRGFESWLAWWGAPLFFTGLLGSLTGWLGAPLSAFLLRSLLTAIMPAYLPQVLLGNGSQLAAAIVSQFLGPVLYQGLLLAALGGIMVALALLLRRLRRAGS